MTDSAPAPRPDATGSAAETLDRERSDFIREMVREDLVAGKYDRVVTRFPPEPNGYLHIGHAKSICLNYGVAEEFDGRYHLRFDDTNPTTEDPEYVESIQNDIRWLGFDWGEHLYFASDYFERMYQLAEKLVEDGKAYVDSSSQEEIRQRRGTVTEDGSPSPYRDRTVAENLDLLRRMRAGEYADGEHVLRAKIDMAANNMLMRDPLLLRIRHAHHYRQGDAWCLYPMYDYAHCLEDAFEGITHSLCTLEFENNRELYDWVLDHTGFEAPRPEQTEFARLNLGFTVMSKRKLLQLVRDGHVAGWDDPRMPTLSGLRRRGYTPESIRAFCDRIGVARNHNVIDVALLEHSVRDDLNHRSQRVMAVLEPLKLVIENYPEASDENPVEELDASYWPHDVPKQGSRAVPFSREILIERSDFEEDPPEGFQRMAPGREVRLRYAYVVRCERAVKDDDGNLVEVRCTYDPATRGGTVHDDRHIHGTIHWLSAKHAIDAEVRLYDRLFATELPGDDGDFLDDLNPESLTVIHKAKVEPSLSDAEVGTRVQFERLGYFVLDATTPHQTWNRTVTLRDSWSKVKAHGDTEEAQRARAKAEARRAYKAQQRQVEAYDPLADLEGDQRESADEFVARGLSDQDARLLVLDNALATFFDHALLAHDDAPSVARWLTTELAGRLGDRELSDLPFKGERMGELAQLVDSGEITNTVGKKVLDLMVSEGGAPKDIIEAKGWSRITDDDALTSIVDSVVAANPNQVAAYRGGKTALMGFFIGQVMSASRGQADAQMVKKLLSERLSAS